MASSDVLRRAATPMRTATTAPQSTTTASAAIVPCALQPRDVAIVLDVWRYKFLSAPQILELWWPDSSSALASVASASCSRLDTSSEVGTERLLGLAVRSHSRTKVRGSYSHSMP